MPAGLESAAREFESLFVQMMLKNMRAAGLSEGILDSQGTEVYLEMFDKEVAREMASSQSLGIAKMLVEQLGSALSGQQADPSVRVAHSAPVMAATAAPKSPIGERVKIDSESASLPVRPIVPPKAVEAAPAIDTNNSPAPAGPAGASISAVQGFESPDAFVAELWQAAQEPARALGVSPSTLIAQSALETGWGKHIPKRADGTSSYNLFGIKAGANWNGDTVTKTTLEFVNGVAEPRREAFRAYGSLNESLTDYVRLVGRAPRYQDAMKVGTDASAFFSELQQAGYATDPSYAKKAITLLQGQTMQAALRRLGAT